MPYAKFERTQKISICNVCRQEKILSWDHVPPKGSIELTPVEQKTLLSVLTGEKVRGTVSQNGVKFKTICSECNEFMGREYDKELKHFSLSVGRLLKTKLYLPKSVTVKAKPQRILKSILGHMLAAKVEIEDTSFDKVAREFVLEKDSKLPPSTNIFFWIYPFGSSATIRDFVMFTPRGTFRDPRMFQLLKFFPLGYLASEIGQYNSLQRLTDYRDCALDDEVEMLISLKQAKGEYWPEAATENEVHSFFGGLSALNSIRATKKF